jgi:glycosyl transferase, family 25
MKRIIEYFDRAYIINLEDRHDRREEAIQEFRRLGIDAPSQNVRFYDAKRLTEKGPFPDVGTRGAFNSHRSVFELASRDRLRNVLVFEDDVSFGDVDPSVEDQIITRLAGNEWDIAHFGYLSPVDEGLEGPLVDFSKGVVGAHFYAVNGNFIDPLIEFMNQCEIRPPGHPDGGPMTADGALNHIRVHIPDMRVLLAVPNLAHQRSSRSDVTPRPILDHIAMLRPLVSRSRAIKHKLRMAIYRRSRRNSNVQRTAPSITTDND